MYLPIVLGTAREGRYSERVAELILDEAEKMGLKVELVDVRDYRVEATDNTGESKKAGEWAAKVKEADALVIVSPEYNHGYPGELKMFFDMLYYEYAGKPVGLCGVSQGKLGGARGMQQLKLLCLALNMKPLLKVLYFPRVRKEGSLDKGEHEKKIRRFLEELVEYAETL